MGKICVFLADGVEEIEALTVVDICRRADVPVAMVSITGNRTITSSHHVVFQAEELIEDVEFEQVDMIVLPGGMPGTLHLEDCQLLMEQVESFHRQGKYLSAICAAPSIFGHRGMLKGRRACSYPDFESHLDGAEVSQNPVEICDHFITSRGMGTATEFALSIVERMKGHECAENIRRKIIYL